MKVRDAKDECRLKIQHPPITCYNENKTLRFEKHAVVPKGQNIKLGRTERK
jgi:hypothetical protein